MLFTTTNYRQSKLSTTWKQLTLTALMLSLTLSGLALTALADDASKASNNQASADYSPSMLKQIPPLPEFPLYGGRSTFVHGVVYANAPGGVSYTYLIGVPEPVQTVKTWYQLALKGNQWNFGPQSNPNVISAMKNGNFCQVEVTPPTRQGDGAQVMVIYHAVRPVATD